MIKIGQLVELLFPATNKTLPGAILGKGSRGYVTGLISSPDNMIGNIWEIEVAGSYWEVNEVQIKVIK